MSPGLLTIRCLGTAFLIAVYVVGCNVFAQVRQSPSYQIVSDSVNVGGGENGVSPSYRLSDTVGEQATGPSESSSYQLQAGYRQMQEVYLAMTTPANVLMSESIGGLTGGSATGSTAVRVTTDGLAGYQITIEAESDPAMIRSGGSGSIADYDPGGTPSFTFDVAADEAAFGFSPEGADIATAFVDDGGVCNYSGAGETDTSDRCWDGLTMSPAVIAQAYGANHPDGVTTTIKFQVEVGADANQLSGTYVATTTVTALPL